MLIIILILAILLCASILFYWRANRNNSLIREQVARFQERLQLSETERQRLYDELNLIKRERDSAITANATVEEKLRHSEIETSRLQKLIDDLKESHNEELKKNEEYQKQLLQQSEANFRLMANDIMERHTATMRQQNEQRLGEILTPLKENIDKFRHDVSECYSAEARERFSLQEKIKELIEVALFISRVSDVAGTGEGSGKEKAPKGRVA